MPVFGDQSQCHILMCRGGASWGLLLEIGMCMLKMSHKERQGVEVFARVKRGGS